MRDAGLLSVDARSLQTEIMQGLDKGGVKSTRHWKLDLAKVRLDATLSKADQDVLLKNIGMRAQKTHLGRVRAGYLGCSI